MFNKKPDIVLNPRGSDQRPSINFRDPGAAARNGSLMRAIIDVGLCIKGDLETEVMQAADQRLRAHDVRHRRGLGQLEGEDLRRHARLAQLRVEERAEILVAERLPRDIDREPCALVGERLRQGREQLEHVAHDPAVDAARDGSAPPPREISQA